MKKLLSKSKQHFSVFRYIAIGFTALMVAFTFNEPANAMHIAEGFLPLKWAGLWYLVALPFVLMGLKSLKKVTEEHPKAKILIAMAGAFTFILSALKIPSLTGSCSHPTGIALGAILFGPAPMAIIGLIVLLFQALLLAHGGISTLGANLFSMGIVGAWVAYGVYKLMRKSGANLSVSVFVAAFLGDLLTYVVTSVQLALAFPAPVGGVMESLVKFMGVFAVTQVPIAVAEGILSVIIFNVIAKYSTSEVMELEKGLGYGSESKIKEVYAQSKMEKGIAKKNIILVAVAILVAVLPLYLLKDAEFGGADGMAMDIVTEINPSFEPILEPFIEPASGEIESMLFALQAAAGAGIIGYGIGKITRKKEKTS